MSRFGRIAFVGLLMAGMLFARSLTLPSGTAACSCMPPDPIGQLAGDPDAVIVSGTILAVDARGDQFGHTLGQFAVERVFQGPVLPRQMPIVGGGGGDCTVSIEAGWHVLMVASLAEGRLTPGLCRHFGLLTTPEGQDLLRQANVAFGPGLAPPGVAPPGVDNPPPTIDLALVAILLVGGVFVVVLFGALILAVGRREQAGPP